MEIRELQAAVEKSRRFSHEIEGRTFDLVLPTQFASNCLVAETKTAARFQRRLVLSALRDWSNVRAHDVVAEAGTSPLPFSEEAAEILFGERPDWEQAIADDIAERMKARRELLEAALGN